MPGVWYGVHILGTAGAQGTPETIRVRTCPLPMWSPPALETDLCAAPFHSSRIEPPAYWLLVIPHTTAHPNSFGSTANDRIGLPADFARVTDKRLSNGLWIHKLRSPVGGCPRSSRETGLKRERVDKWSRQTEQPERNRMEPRNRREDPTRKGKGIQTPKSSSWTSMCRCGQIQSRFP